MARAADSAAACHAWRPGVGTGDAQASTPRAGGAVAGFGTFGPENGLSLGVVCPRKHR